MKKDSPLPDGSDVVDAPIDLSDGDDDERPETD